MHYDIQIKIKYENKIFYSKARNYYDKKEATWKCQNYIRIKDLPQKQNIFCQASVERILQTNKEKFKFFEKRAILKFVRIYIKKKRIQK